MSETGLGRSLVRQAAGARNTQSLGGNAEARPKTAVVHNKERLRLARENFSQGKLRSETTYWPREHSLSALRELPGPGPGSVGPSEGPKEAGTGHSQMELLWRVLAEGVSAPSARKLTVKREFGASFRSKRTKPRE